MADEWQRSLMLHDWPECGPGALSLESLYEMFKARYDREKDLERHAPDCWLRDYGEECSCRHVPNT